MQLAFFNLLMQKIIQELFGVQCQIIGVTDNRSLRDACYSTTTMEDKRSKIDICVLRDMLKNSDITAIKWVPKDEQIADSLTKMGASTVKLIDALSCSINLLHKSK